MKARDFEQKVLDIDSIRIMLRVGSNVEVGDYNYQKAADENQSLADWEKVRLKKCLNDAEIEYHIYDKDHREPHGNRQLRTIRIPK